MEPYLILENCSSCGDCVELCPTESISFGVQHFEIDTETCRACGICFKVCPEAAIQKPDKKC